MEKYDFIRAWGSESEGTPHVNEECFRQKTMFCMFHGIKYHNDDNDGKNMIVAIMIMIMIKTRRQ